MILLRSLLAVAAHAVAIDDRRNAVAPRVDHRDRPARRQRENAQAERPPPAPPRAGHPYPTGSTAGSRVARCAV